jgi:hypothetical protein
VGLALVAGLFIWFGVTMGNMEKAQKQQEVNEFVENWNAPYITDE